MNNLKISSFYIMTEPEKMGYPYLESITSALSFSDEVVLIMGRDEKVSEDKIYNLASRLGASSKIKVVKTDAWPAEGWGYDVMKEHIQRGLDECTHDICVKIDCDYVFRDQYGDEIRKTFLGAMPGQHMMTLGRVNYFNPRLAVYSAAVDNTPCYVVNKRALRSDGITCFIDNESGSNQPMFKKDGRLLSSEDINLVKVGEKFPKNLKDFVWQYHIMCPVNFSYAFMTPMMIAKTWSAWFRAVELKFGESRKPEFDISDMRSSFIDFLRYHGTFKVPSLEESRKTDDIRLYIYANNMSVRDAVASGVLVTNENGEPLIGGHMSPEIEFYPLCMHHRILGVPDNVWGHNNFSYEGFVVPFKRDVIHNDYRNDPTGEIRMQHLMAWASGMADLFFPVSNNPPPPVRKYREVIF